jgi:hypothetical protein
MHNTKHNAAIVTAQVSTQKLATEFNKGKSPSSIELVTHCWSEGSTTIRVQCFSPTYELLISEQFRQEFGTFQVKTHPTFFCFKISLSELDCTLHFAEQFQTVQGRVKSLDSLGQGHPLDFTTKKF